MKTSFSTCSAKPARLDDLKADGEGRVSDVEAVRSAPLAVLAEVVETTARSPSWSARRARFSPAAFAEAAVRFAAEPEGADPALSDLAEILARPADDGGPGMSALERMDALSRLASAKDERSRAGLPPPGQGFDALSAALEAGKA